VRQIFYMSEVPLVGPLLRIFNTLVDVFSAFLPFILLIIFGLVVGKGVYLLFSRFLRIIHFDRLFSFLEDRKIFTPSLSVARFFYFFTVLVFFLHAVEYVALIDAAELAGEIITVMEHTLVLFSLVALVYFAAHYVGSILEFLVDITGFDAGVYVYYLVILLSIVSLAGVIFENYVPLDYPLDILATFSAAVLVLLMIFFRREIRNRLEREKR